MNTELSSRLTEAAGRIPTGFRPKAQGCEARATLGNRESNIINRNAVAANTTQNLDHNPVGVEIHFVSLTQGSSCLATLGWRTQSLWDCWRATTSMAIGGAL